ncbi:response regulator [Desulfobacter hydrogenophilus]|uniref:Response regulator n=1 Tax=Desulfobacter hydrogenophilus TaxID=2291 RepID=A0A328FJP5_9BACT|nr:HEAT repeat domain-containing protein [Desulfobacter hydrogenophilus]NDY72811.1 response regulator [Desulfobacter hydrogenophilus]QBH13037.1 response regulator [Desulfobacter hydrogenophilus]RAM04020.1 response regulator [Desulfobacter hydrogenophilus]
MGGINAQDFINELVFCLNEKDTVKAKALLQFASDANVDVQIQKMALAKLAKGPENVVFPLLEYLTKIDISNTEIQESLYDLILDKAYGNTNLVTEYIINNEKKTRIQFIRAAGDLFLKETIPVLIQVVQGETDPEIIAPAINSLAVFRKPKHIEIFSSFTTHSDPDIIKAAIFAIGAMSNPQAADTLISFLCEDETINKLVVQALAEKQDLYDLETITRLLSSPVTIIRDTAIDELINMGKKATPLLTKAFQNAESDYMVHLITTLGYIEDQAAIPAIMNIINTQPKDANIRQAAYEAMERIPSPRTAICLVQGLQDPEESVRMSAARAVDKNLSKPLVAGLKNIVRDKSPEAISTVSALIDTDATNIFNFLMGEESFRELAGTHIAEKASPATRKAFLKNMVAIGQIEFAKEIAAKITETGQAKASSSMKIVVVDDSKMMLKLYQNKLSILGLTCEIFHRPEEAVKRILSGKTDLVITDLNMPNISGLELTMEIRRKFTRTDLPILMITTQSDFVEEKEGDIDITEALLKKSGINKILHKPFSDNDFKESVFKLLPT